MSRDFTRRQSAQEAPLPPFQPPSAQTRRDSAIDALDEHATVAIRRGLPAQESRLREAEEAVRRCEEMAKRAQQDLDTAVSEMQNLQWEVDAAKNALGHEAADYLRTLMMANGVFGIDIGGTAAKIAYFQSSSGHDSFVTDPIFERERWGCSGQRLRELQFAHPQQGGVVHFMRFATHRVNPVLEQLHDERVRSDTEQPHPQRCVYATGGGAFKFEKLSRNAVGVSYAKVGEFESLVDGLRLLLRICPESVYSVDPTAPPGTSAKVLARVDPDSKFLICNIGSGVSIIKVEKENAQRVGGTSIGGSSFLGLSRLAAGANDFDDAVRMAGEGEPNNVDLTVRDIYGKRGEQHLGLPGGTVACSFGRVVSMENPRAAEAKDIAASLLKMVTQAISLYTCTLAELHDCKLVFFTGGFLRMNPASERRFAEACSVTSTPALFLRHADYLGALGCLHRRLGPGASPAVGPLTPKGHPLPPAMELPQASMQLPGPPVPASPAPTRVTAFGRTHTTPPSGPHGGQARRVSAEGIDAHRVDSFQLSLPGAARVRGLDPLRANPASPDSVPSEPVHASETDTPATPPPARPPPPPPMAQPPPPPPARGHLRQQPLLTVLLFAAVLGACISQGTGGGAAAAGWCVVIGLLPFVRCAARTWELPRVPSAAVCVAVCGLFTWLSTAVVRDCVVLLCWACFLQSVSASHSAARHIMDQLRDHATSTLSASAAEVRLCHAALQRKMSEHRREFGPAEAAMALASAAAGMATLIHTLAAVAVARGREPETDTVVEPAMIAVFAVGGIAGCCLFLWAPVRAREARVYGMRALARRGDAEAPALLALATHDPLDWPLSAVAVGSLLCMVLGSVVGAPAAAAGWLVGASWSDACPA
eukprot:TRINITY_DN29761_c0_g1_i1.p1 TRINITY_DN29761_c0_g1~~TRINITY_DN29761_c0_g1_i1.p1  ORF type:complete len:878 (+),score=289.30 TRINITY_DN29761_c0_g1_i1:52-2685(+)